MDFRARGLLCVDPDKPWTQRITSLAVSATLVCLANPRRQCTKQACRTHSTSLMKDLPVASPRSRTPISSVVTMFIPDVVYHSAAWQERTLVSRTICSYIIGLSISQLRSTTAISHPQRLRVPVFSTWLLARADSREVIGFLWIW